LNLNKFKKYIVLILTYSISLLLLLLLLINSPFIQSKLFNFFSEKIENKYSIKISTDHFYYNLFNNKLTTNFTVIDHYGQSMIYLPKINIKFKNSLLLNTDLIINKVEIISPEFNIQKYSENELTNFEIFIDKISNNQSSSFNSIEVKEINFKDCLFTFQNKNIYYEDVNILLKKMSFNQNHKLSFDQISIQNRENNFLLDLNYDIPNKHWTSNIYRSSLDINNLHPDLDGTLYLNLNIQAKDSLIFSNNFDLSYNESYINGNFNFNQKNSNVNIGLEESFFLNIDLNKLSFNKYKKQLSQFDSLKYQGKIEFIKENTILNGLINTQYGDLNLDFTCHPQSDSISKINYFGIIDLDNFKIGEFYNNKLFDKLSLKSTIEGHFFNSEIYAKINLDKAQFDFNGYSYKNISFSGDIFNNYLNGKLEITDDNININVDGLVDLRQNLPIFNVNANLLNINFDELNLNKSIKNFSGNIYANFSGNNINNIKGDFYGDKISYFNNKKEFINNVSVSFSNHNNENTIILDSEIGNGTFTYNFDYKDLYPKINNIFSSYLQDEKIDYSGDDFFDFNLVLEDASFFTSLFYTDLDLGKVVISSDYNLDNNYILNANISDILIDQYYLNNFKLQLSGFDEKLDCNIFLNQLINKNSTLLDTLHFSINSNKGNLEYNLNWLYNDSLLYNGSLAGEYIFKNEYNELTFKNSKFYLADKLWNISKESVIHAKKNNFSLSNFSLESNNERIDISGGYDNYVKIYFDFFNFDLNLINYFRKADASKFDGRLDGSIWYSSISKPIGGYLKIKDFKMNNILLGEMILNAQSNLSRSSLILDAYIKPFDSQKNLNLNGSISLDNNNIDINANFNGFNTNFLDPLLNSISNPKGKLYGTTRFYGPHDNYLIDGYLDVDSLSFTVPYLNTNYNLNKPYKILFNRDSIILDSVNFFDTKHNSSALFYGETKYSNAFRTVYYNFNISSDSIYSLNTNISHNNLYYGNVFASGNLSISGSPSGVSFNIDAKSKKGTKFNIPLSYYSDIEESEFIRFVGDSLIDYSTYKDLNENEYSFIMDFDLEITPDSQVKLIYDENIGDIIEGNGAGNLRLKIGQDGFFKIFGDVTIEEGEYLFTMQNIVNKNFKIENGGTLHWEGDPYNADIDFYANYVANTSLKLLDNDYNSNNRLPVICRMHMTEKLLSPKVDFIIDIPDATDVARVKLSQLTDSQQKLLQQFAFLLVSNSFLVEESGEDYLNNSLTVTGTELISNQLSNWLSQTTDDFDLGFKWIPGSSDSLTTDQVEIAFSQKFLNDRLTINGNASNANTPEAQAVTNIVGEVDILYNLDKYGKLKLKAFNRADAYDPLYGDEFRYEQGFGLFYKKDFDSFLELFKRKKK